MLTAAQRSGFSTAAARPRSACRRLGIPAVRQGSTFDRQARQRGIANTLWRWAHLYSGLMFAVLITLPHFSVSSTMSLANSAGDIGIGSPPRSASRSLSWRSASPALIALLSLLTISAGVPFGAPTPKNEL